jgi:NADP-dependent 3-hydroxy acid dehydrogenase YdfG
MALKGKGALITGGGTGTGRSIALALAEQGCKVGITGRRESALAETAELASDGSIVYHTADVADRDDVKRLMDWTADAIGDIHILVNSAGVNIKDRTVAELSPEDFDKMMRINCTGTYNTTWAVLPQMRERQDGVIVNISSIAGIRSSLLAGVGYSTSKFAMAALGRGVALEEGDNGIRVTNIYPGEINTPILEQRPEPVSDERKTKMLQPDDLGVVVAMIANLPPHAHIAELVIKPTNQTFH